jgi:hypothetical protein
MCAVKLDKSSIYQGEQRVLGDGQAARIYLIDLLSLNLQPLWFWLLGY